MHGSDEELCEMKKAWQITKIHSKYREKRLGHSRLNHKHSLF